jgi:hypothetical protein
MPIADEPFNLHDFRKIVGDPARPYLFLVHIPEIGTDKVMTCMARSTELPGYDLGEVGVHFQGMQINLGTPPTYGPWTVNFLCDEAHELRRIMLRWQSLVYDAGTMLLGHSDSYKSDQLGVAQMARQGQKVAVYGFVGAFPKTVGPISVGQDQTSGVETFDVTFRYDYYVIINQFGDDQIGVNPFVRADRSPRIERGAPPPAGNWTTPFNPQ